MKLLHLLLQYIKERQMFRQKVVIQEEGKGQLKLLRALN